MRRANGSLTLIRNGPTARPAAAKPRQSSEHRGCIWTTAHFPGQRLLLVHGAEGELLGEFRVPDRLATEAFEQMIIDWLEAVDPIAAPVVARPQLALAR